MEVDSGVFSVLDYCLFFSMLLVSVLIGVYFGFLAKSKNDPDEYLFGGKSMEVLPIAASLVASDVSGLTLLGLPADIYAYGTAFWTSIISTAITTVAISELFLPVFYGLQVSSCYEYLGRRYGPTVCVLASGIFALTALLFMPIVVYVPALAFSQVSGFNLHIIVPLVCVVTIFYTTVGGIKAVVWTDTLQMVIMVGSLITVFTMGTVFEGGFANIWKKNQEGGRIDFNLDADPTSRTAVITIIFGTAVLSLSYGINPIFIQRFLAVRTLRDAKITCYLLLLGNTIMKSMSIFMGLILYAHYKDCDPLLSGKIQKMDQLIPYYITNVSAYLPGLPGIFIAGVFCAALSTMSSGLNTMSGTIYKDLIFPRISTKTSDRHANNIMKLIVVMFGLFAMILVYVVEHLGGILQLSLILGGLSAGPLLSMFLLGMMTTFANLQGVMWGSIGGIVAVGWLLFGAQYYTLMGRIPPKILPLTTYGCANNITALNNTLSSIDIEPPLFPYRISFLYYPAIGCLVTILIAIPISLLTGGRQQIVDKSLLSPIFHSKPAVAPEVKDDPKELARLRQ